MERPRRARLTLVQAFVMAIAGISVVAGAALYVFVSACQRSILESAERLRDAAAQRTESRILRDLDEASTSLASIERALRLGAARGDTPLALEPMAFAELVNHPRLAARLESLGKQYGVAILVSEAVDEEARDAFAFRLVDRVAVKGKTKPVRVFELLGAIDRVAGSTLQRARVYERALDAYFERQFVAAKALLADQRDDGPSGVLYARCEEMRASPPRETWDGVYVATSK
jgi:hypothetical protein